MSAAARREVIEQAATEVFAERGYHAASIDEIARRSGVSAPVVYDHFDSKLDLYRRLLERHRDELLALWREHLVPARRPRPPRARRLGALRRGPSLRVEDAVPRGHGRRAGGGRPIAQVQAGSRAALTTVLGADAAVDRGGTVRSGLTGLALWWQDHPEVTREQIVATAMNVLWTASSGGAR